MKIDIWHNILWSRYKGGVFSSLDKLARSRGVEISFFQIAETDSQRQSLNAVDLSYHQYPFTLLFPGSYDSIRLVQLYFTLFWRVFRSDADLIILCGYHRLEYWIQFLALLLLGRARGVFCDSTIADHPRSVLKGALKGFFFRNCDAIFCYGLRSKEYVLSYGVEPSRVRFRCQAAALPSDYDVKQVLARRLEEVSRTPLFLYVGRLSAEKNLARLIEAFAHLHRKSPHARLRLVGDGPLLGTLQALVETQGLADAVRFVGSLDQAALAREYLSATCLALPSLSEPWGIVVNEALSYGCPVLVSDHCGCCPELVVEGISGFTFDPTSVAEIAAKMSSAAESWRDVEQTARNCLVLIQNYSPQIAAEQILDGCLSVVSDSTSQGAV
ncbi:glycosyltransferase family 4 protein [Methylosinus sp. LW3]|uniref:glycosyltransferase family 4 protein n=1 Tax=Methylosinus sp. LW3 TaxID=107635 RepID=UPI0004649F1D|nr:glycosyltransferase family 4 protein [Methylosinus sp. LW3]